MVRRTKEEAQETRNRILDAAERVFQERGVSRTSLNEIALDAGVTRGAIYWHFQDKADLFNAMLERVTLPFEDAIKGPDDAGAGPLDVLRKTFSAAIQKTVNDPQVRRVFEIATHKVEYVDETRAVRDRHLAVRNEMHEHMTRRIALAMAQGQLANRVSADTAAFGLHAMIDGLIQNWMLDPDAFDLLVVGEQVLDTYLAGLAVKTP